MEYGSIEREIYIDASPEIVFQVLSSSEHVANWWSDEAQIEPINKEGQIVFRSKEGTDDKMVALTVVERAPSRRFSFRWDFPAGAAPREDNSLLVTFELEPTGDGTTVKMNETGFREQGWEAAVLEAKYLDHVNGWNYFIPRLGEYAAGLVSAT